MNAALAKRIEKNIERASSALLAGAVAFAAYAYLGRTTAQPQLGALTGAAGAMAYLLSARVLKAIGKAKPRYRVPIFDLREIEPAIDELLLTQMVRLPAAATPADEPLVLDDILAAIGPDARVVRLFDPAAMPTPGQLKARIDHHLENGSPGDARPDASEALHQALSELRQSLR